MIPLAVEALGRCLPHHQPRSGDERLRRSRDRGRRSEARIEVGHRMAHADDLELVARRKVAPGPCRQVHDWPVAVVEDRVAEARRAKDRDRSLDAEQVRRLAAGLPIEDPRPAAARVPVADEDEARPRQKERTPIVPALNKPITQE